MHQIMQAHHVRVQGPVRSVEPLQGVPERKQDINNNAHDWMTAFLWAPAYLIVC